jgi:hypothetical protein
VSPDGSDRRRRAPAGDFSALAISPHGKIAYTSAPDGFRLFVLGRKRETVRVRSLLTFLAWSPDGRTLLVAGGRGELYALSLRTRRLDRLTSGMAFISGMAWR